MDVGKTKISPIVVKHPFTDSGITMVKTRTGNFEMVNLLQEEDLEKWRRYALVFETIEKSSIYSRESFYAERRCLQINVKP